MVVDVEAAKDQSIEMANHFGSKLHFRLFEQVDGNLIACVNHILHFSREVLLRLGKDEPSFDLEPYLLLWSVFPSILVVACTPLLR